MDSVILVSLRRWSPPLPHALHTLHSLATLELLPRLIIACPRPVLRTISLTTTINGL